MAASLKLPRWLRMAAVWLLVACSSWAQTAESTQQAVMDLASTQGAEMAPYLPLPLRAITGLPASSTPEQALAVFLGKQPPSTGTARIEAFDPQKVYALASDTALWLHLRLRSDPLSQKRWVLNFVNTYLDRVELHAVNAQGVWQSEVAGDNIAHSQWSQRTLVPQVLLPVMAAGEQDVLIKVVHGFPQKIQIKLIEHKVAQQKNHQDFLLAGLLTGLLGVILLLSMHLALSYRDVAYAWYALYMLLAILSSSTYLGLASYWLWPDAADWPEYSILFLIQAAVTAQLWFAQVMFLRDGQWPVLRKLTQAVVAISVAIGVICLFIPSPSHRMAAFAVANVICFCMIFLIVGQTLRHKPQKAVYFWVLAYVPLTVVLALAILLHFSWITGFDLPYELPIYPLIFEALVLLAALHMHAKDRHAMQVKARAVAELDPLTGFFNSITFNKQAKLLWEKSLRQRDDFSLALIQVQHATDRSDSQSALKLEKKMQRTVRLLRAIMRDVDVVGRIGGNTLALAMPGIPMGDELNNRLSRLVAQGLMRDAYDTDATEMRFRIAAGSRLTFGDSLSALDNTLRGEISQSLGWSRKPIHYIAPASAPGELPTANSAAQLDSGINGSLDSAAMSSGASSRPTSSAPSSKPR